ncbi:MAG TPA: acyl-CoA synthetase [Solirubrobacteraceae bacterium]|nr:acyl-CoA synthetase [Solirubrobacteraceae bacterium]
MLFPALADPAADRTALSFPDRTLSYVELARAARAFAGELEPTGRVAVLAEPRIETAVAVISALVAGVPAILINPKSGSSELAHIVGDAEPAAIAVAPDSEVPAAFQGRREVRIDLDAAGAAGAQDGSGERPELSDDDPALIVYTSGTTGRPKGAVLPRRSIASNLDALAEVWGWTDADVVAHGLPLFHVHGLVLGILGPVRRGGTALHIGRFAPEGVQAALHGAGTMLFGVPTMYRRLADAAVESPELAKALGGARLLVSGSAALPATEHARIEELTGRGVVERYGMTETLMNTAIHADAKPAPGTVGPPLPGVEVRLVDDDGAVLEGADDETIGEIQVRGPNLFLEYLNRPDATAEAMRDGWFATGDMATRTVEGYIRIVGRRATDLIKSGGYKIGAGEIEGCLREHPAVEDAAVTGEADDDLGERVVAWIVLRDGASVPESELIDHVADLLAPHKRPRDVHFLDELPRNDMGKVQKARLGTG